MRALDPHTRRASLSSGVEAAHSAKNLTVKMSMMMMMVMVMVMVIIMTIMVMVIMVLMMMDTFEFLAALLQMHWADSKL